jgi:hypothetical protein
VALFLFAKFQASLCQAFLKTLRKKIVVLFIFRKIAGGGQRTLYGSLKKNEGCFFNRLFMSLFFKKTIAI